MTAVSSEGDRSAVQQVTSGGRKGLQLASTALPVLIPAPTEKREAQVSAWAGLSGVTDPPGKGVQSCPVPSGPALRDTRHQSPAGHRFRATPSWTWSERCCPFQWSQVARLGAGMKGRRRQGALCRSAQESEGGSDRLPRSVLWPGQECGSASLSVSLSSPRAPRSHAL